MMKLKSLDEGALLMCVTYSYDSFPLKEKKARN